MKNWGQEIREKGGKRGDDCGNPQHHISRQECKLHSEKTLHSADICLATNSQSTAESAALRDGVSLTGGSLQAKGGAIT